MPATDLPNTESSPESDTESNTRTAAYPVLPIPDGVIFPEMVVTISLQSPEARQLLDSVATDRNRNGRSATILLVPRTDGSFAKVGVTATVEDRDAMPDGTPVLTLRAHHRAIVGSGVVGRTDGLWVQAEVVEDPNLTTAPPSEAVETTRGLAVAYRAMASALLDRVGGGRAIGAIPKVDKPGPLADSISYWPEISHEQKIKLLETVGIDDRLRLATVWAKAALAEIDVRRDIERNVSEGLEDNQREAILRRQMATIQSELGEGDGDAIAEYRAKLAELTVEGSEFVPEATADAIDREINRLERIGNESMESNWIRTWLDTVFDIPWANSAAEHIELGEARSILDEDHTGLDEVKERLVEYLAVRQLRTARNEARIDAGSGSDGSQIRGRRRGGAILALVGPPGVGKTSLGESVARSLGRSFVRLALGGVRDEAEIRGHRRTYVGARAGRLVNALVEAESMNPVVLLDEIDKVSGGWNGDPSAALLEVLDPAQNHSFRDHYLEFELDLSDVVFIATANTLETIPGPLLDRLEIISIDGYTTAEKVTIGRDHLLPRLIERNGLMPGELEITDDAIEGVAADYTREAGVRQLERQLDKVARKAAVTIGDKIGNKSDENPSLGTVSVTIDDIGDLLGKPIPREETVDRIDRPGIATGLAVTGAGGDVLFVETALVEGSGEPILTGQLGDVMKESASIVASLVSIQLEAEGKSMPTDRRIHVHFPAGAIPKDGPSAGITMTTALISLLTGRQVRADVAMTGEITLQGKVLPIGGVKQKVLAAHRAGVKTVLLPIGNGRDLDDIPDDVRDLVTIKLVSTIDEVLTEALQ